MDINYYEAFLKAVGFEADEIPVFLPEWRQAADRLGLTAADMRFAAEEWIPQNFDVQLKSVRRLLGLFIKETTDLLKAKEYKAQGVKIVYGILPAQSIFYYALKMAAPERVFVGFPDVFLTVILQGFFHKLNPFLEEAERHGIPYGCRHCALNKTRYAARRLDIIPSPDISWIWGLVCDEGPKSDEFIQRYYAPDWNTYVLRIPRDQPWGTREDEVPERVEYLAAQMKDGLTQVSKAIGVEVSEKQIREVIDFRQSYYAKLSEMRRLMAADPQPYGGIENVLLSYPLQMPINTGFGPWEEVLELVQELVASHDKNS